MQKGRLKKRLLVRDEEVNFATLGGVRGFSIRNIGNVPMLIDNIDPLPIDETFNGELDMLIINESFSIKFLPDGVVNPVQRAILWYGVPADIQ